jgi:hypothetical protein
MANHPLAARPLDDDVVDPHHRDDGGCTTGCPDETDGEFALGDNHESRYAGM